jgi:hypothetical protein
MRLPPLSTLLTRAALAFCFLGFGLWELISPRLWIIYVPEYMSQIADPAMLVFVHGITLTVTALGVLSGWFPRFFTAVASLIMLEICIEIWVGEGFTDVFIRDVAILLFAAAMFAEASINSTRDATSRLR